MSNDDTDTSTASTMHLRVTFIGDPMCSWCYGFAPELEKLRHEWAGRAKFRLLVGGLRRDTSPIDERMKAFLAEHWDDVSQRTGQPFNHGILETPLRYDTEPACRATVTARHLAPAESQNDAAFRFFHKSQIAFYRDNHDPHDLETWVRLAESFGFPADDFIAAYHDESLKKETQRDFETSRELGITGYPSLIADRGDLRRYITLGYAPYETLNQRLEHFVDVETSD